MKIETKIILTLLAMLLLTAQAPISAPRLSRNGTFTVYGTSRSKTTYQIEKVLDDFNQKRDIQCLQQLRGYDYIILGRSADYSSLDKGERGAIIVQYKRLKYVISTTRDEEGYYTGLEGEVIDLIKKYGLIP